MHYSRPGARVGAPGALAVVGTSLVAGLAGVGSAGLGLAGVGAGLALVGLARAGSAGVGAGLARLGSAGVGLARIDRNLGAPAGTVRCWLPAPRCRAGDGHCFAMRRPGAIGGGPGPAATLPWCPVAARVTPALRDPLRAVLSGGPCWHCGPLGRRC